MREDMKSFVSEGSRSGTDEPLAVTGGTIHDVRPGSWPQPPWTGYGQPPTVLSQRPSPSLWSLRSRIWEAQEGWSRRSLGRNVYLSWGQEHVRVQLC